MVGRRMSNVFFEVSISGRNDGTVEAVYIHLSDRKVARTVEKADRQLVVDYDRDGNVVGIEILEPVAIRKLTSLVDSSFRSSFKRFVQESVPQDFVQV